MAFWIRRGAIACLAGISVAAGVMVHVHPARAAAAYQGIYVIIDPYSASDVQMLQSAAQVSCTGDQAAQTPFCTAANGILLRIAWCDFQLYHVNNPQGQPYPSCHYVVGFSKNVGIQEKSNDTISPCLTYYDICTSPSASVLGTTLALIAKINASRGQAGLDPLKLSVGMYAGVGTPEAILDSTGYVDVVHNVINGNLVSQNQCYRLPLVWKTYFTNSYNSAIDELFSYIKSQLPQGANITVVKAAGIVANDLEVSMPGRANAITAPVDPGPAGPGPALNCSSIVFSAQTWLNAYTAAPVSGKNYAQAVESAFGTIIGHEIGSAANAGFAHALISMPTSNSTSFALVNCGVSETSACAVSPNTGDWSTYYLEHYTIDLFNGGLAYTAAKTAYQAIRSDTFSFPPNEFSINWTGLTTAKVNSISQVECTLNNTVAAHAPSLTLNLQPVQIIGVGTTIGWQTNSDQGYKCKSGKYAPILTNGIDDGGLFEEVETDAALADIASCSPYLTDALTEITALSPPTVCVY